MKSYEIFSAVDPSVVTGMLDWFRTNDRNVYRSAVATLAQSRKLRPVFVEKKPVAEQYAWIHKILQLRTSESAGDQILQAYLMAGQQPMLAAFCDAMGIPHDGKGAVSGELPEVIEADKLATAIDGLLEKFEAPLVTIYLTCFNRQVAGGWPAITEKLSSDERLRLS